MNIRGLLTSIGLFIVIIVVGVVIWQLNQQPQHLLSGTVTEQGDFKHTEAGKYYTVSIVVPNKTPLYSMFNHAADQKARDAMEHWFQSQLPDFIKATDISDMPADYRAMFEHDGRTFAYDATYSASSSTNGKLISYAYTIYEDTGGAHPNTYFHTFAFDKAGNEIQLSDLFTPGSDYLQRLASTSLPLVTADLAQRLQLPPEMNVNDALFKEGLDPKAENFQNFIVDRDQLVLLFPPYQVAAYVAGSFEVHIPLSQLSDILNPKYK